MRYHSGDGAGHVAWAFDAFGEYAVCGSVENHSGHMFTPATAMGYWDALGSDPMREMRKRAYDDMKWIEVKKPNPLAAYRTMLWIKTRAYFAVHRNCEDDVYDILRAYGVKSLPPPLLHWFPKGWFRALTGAIVGVQNAQSSQLVEGQAPPQTLAKYVNAKPKRPSWRRPWHPYFHLLILQKAMHTIRHLLLWAKRANR